MGSADIEITSSRVSSPVEFIRVGLGNFEKTKKKNANCFGFMDVKNKLPKFQTTKNLNNFFNPMTFMRIFLRHILNLKFVFDEPKINLKFSNKRNSIQTSSGDRIKECNCIENEKNAFCRSQIFNRNSTLSENRINIVNPLPELIINENCFYHGKIHNN